jgi:hypothetical protein
MSSNYPAWTGDVVFLNSNTDAIPLSTLTPLVDSLRKAQPTSWRHLHCVLRFHATLLPFRLSDEDNEDDKGASAASPNTNLLVKSLPDSPASALETIIEALVRFLTYRSRYRIVFTYCCLKVVHWFRPRKANL